MAAWDSFSLEITYKGITLFSLCIRLAWSYCLNLRRTRWVLGVENFDSAHVGTIVNPSFRHHRSEGLPGNTQEKSTRLQQIQWPLFIALEASPQRESVATCFRGAHSLSRLSHQLFTGLQPYHLFFEGSQNCTSWVWWHGANPIIYKTLQGSNHPWCRMVQDFVYQYHLLYCLIFVGVIPFDEAGDFSWKWTEELFRLWDDLLWEKVQQVPDSWCMTWCTGLVVNFRPRKLAHAPPAQMLTLSDECGGRRALPLRGRASFSHKCWYMLGYSPSNSDNEDFQALGRGSRRTGTYVEYRNISRYINVSFRRSVVMPFANSFVPSSSSGIWKMTAQKGREAVPINFRSGDVLLGLPNSTSWKTQTLAITGSKSAGSLEALCFRWSP